MQVKNNKIFLVPYCDLLHYYFRQMNLALFYIKFFFVRPISDIFLYLNEVKINKKTKKMLNKIL